MFMLFRERVRRRGAGPRQPLSRAIWTTWYGLHPAIAETVNYIIQRADLLFHGGVVAGMVMYIRLPRLRKFGLYLIPVAWVDGQGSGGGFLRHFAGVHISVRRGRPNGTGWGTGFVSSFPAIVVCVAFAYLNVKMVSKDFTPTIMSSQVYWATQPYVIMRYFRSFFLPLWLSADTDLTPLSASRTRRRYWDGIFVWRCCWWAFGP